MKVTPLWILVPPILGQLVVPIVVSNRNSSLASSHQLQPKPNGFTVHQINNIKHISELEAEPDYTTPEERLLPRGHAKKPKYGCISGMKGGFCQIYKESDLKTVDEKLQEKADKNFKDTKTDKGNVKNKIEIFEDLDDLREHQAQRILPSTLTTLKILKSVLILLHITPMISRA